MCFENQGAMAHLPDPGIRQSGSLQEPSRPLNSGKACGYLIGDRELGSKSSHAGLWRYFLALRKGGQKSKLNPFLQALERMIPRFCTIYPGPAQVHGTGSQVHTGLPKRTLQTELLPYSVSQPLADQGLVWN
jgi:hypothetical protein